MTILEELAGFARERVKQAKTKISPEEMRQRAIQTEKGDFAFDNFYVTSYGYFNEC